VASVDLSKQTGQSEEGTVWPIVKVSLLSSTLTALQMGVARGILSKPEPLHENCINPRFKGFPSRCL
jgi:hypothetical protein